MLNRNKRDQFHYYQPGIGTYVASPTLPSHDKIQRTWSALLKAKDAAVGSSFDEHVVGGYRFLMQYYSPGDDIYFIGFSRGAYVARSLAEMLDYIGLLEVGNEELVRFAWKIFSKWQQRRNDTEKDRKKKDKLFQHMKAFRETFSRPTSRIRFLGLFDTVNSVPRYESAWMQRSSRFPCTTRSSARIIRHAVSIDERRAKFRQDLISGGNPSLHRRQSGHYLHGHPYHHPGDGRKPHQSPAGVEAGKVDDEDDDDDEDVGTQDVEELWFPGCHSDIGGGWKHNDHGSWPLSHTPLVWMVQEARRAGLELDFDKLKEFECYEDERPIVHKGTASSIHHFVDDNEKQRPSTNSSFQNALYISSTQGFLHDSLSFNSGLAPYSVLIWRIMEYLPFKRMDLQEDGTWKPIRWPLPRGEVRDIPKDARVHVSAVRRMKANSDYRPGNLIVGGGGRGIRRAPAECGIGEWNVLKDQGDVVRETYVRAEGA